MAEWREALRGYIVPLEIVLFVPALVALGIVMVGRRSGSLPTPTAWMLGVDTLVEWARRSRVAIVDRCGSGGARHVALALVVVPPRSAHPRRA